MAVNADNVFRPAVQAAALLIRGHPITQRQRLNLSEYHQLVTIVQQKIPLTPTQQHAMNFQHNALSVLQVMVEQITNENSQNGNVISAEASSYFQRAVIDTIKLPFPPVLFDLGLNLPSFITSNARLKQVDFQLFLESEGTYNLSFLNSVVLLTSSVGVKINAELLRPPFSYSSKFPDIDVRNIVIEAWTALSSVIKELLRATNMLDTAGIPDKIQMNGFPEGIRSYLEQKK